MRNFMILVVFFIVGCGGNEKMEPVTSRGDYDHYLKGSAYKGGNVRLVHDEEINFWKMKVAAQPNGFLYLQKLAALQMHEFEYSGNIDHISISDSLLILANSQVRGKHKIPGLLSLSSNAIKKHEFKQALSYGYQANELATEKFAPHMMIYDAFMELGNYDLAGSIIKEYQTTNSFDYLVRLSKYQDHLGNLDSAILLMEEALDIVRNEKNERALWAEANLADMYGHAGRIKQSYQGYLHVLSKEPEYLYALKGIAWIAYAYDNKPEEAIDILHYILSKRNLPDTHLLLAELYDFTKRTDNKKYHLSLFIKQAAQPKFSGMYNAHLVELYAEEFGQYDHALELAKKEVEKRPTPAVYDLLAWVYHEKGDHKMAYKIMKKHVEGRTFEPDILYHIGMIYASNGDMKKAKVFLTEAYEASFELGPMKANEIRIQLDKL